MNLANYTPTLVTCDLCEGDFPYGDRHVAATVRPSDPTEVVAVMWACPACGPEAGFETPEEVERAVERGDYGSAAFFITV